MPCDRCGARQSDPVRGASPWKRGVRAGRQVLICPDCQREPDWTEMLDRCPTCDSTVLVRALGETRCRSCGQAEPAAAATSDRYADAVPGARPAHPSAAADLAGEVAAALDRVLRRPPGER